MKKRLYFIVLMSCISTLCQSLVLQKQKNCDNRTVIKTQTECTSCAVGIRKPCRTGTKITSGIGVKGCSYTVDMGGVVLSMIGCTHTCMSVVTIPECCKGYWGTACRECPGGFAKPCNGHGTCLDGRNGNGTCVCDVGFTGFSCNVCAENILYGSDCSSVCECNHGICRYGISGDGSCICEAGYNGAKCDEVSLPCKSLNCGENTRCMEVNRKFQCQCLPGYIMKGKSCQSKDPCTPPPCSIFGVCTGLGPGKYKCMCKPGYYGDGATCLPIDPCAINNGGCFENSTRCTYRGPGKSFCSCLPGMTSINPARGCKLSRVCLLTSCDKSAQCETLPSGSYKCNCHEGEIGDGKSCYGSILYQLNKLNIEDLQIRKQLGAMKIFEEACGLTLRKYGPFTVFVPLMKFKWMNETEAKEFCKLHVVPGQHLTHDLILGKELWTLSGQVLEVVFTKKKFIKISEPGKTYNIMKSDYPASNGVFHFIDLPITFDYVETLENQKMAIGDILSANDQFSRFQTMLENCGLPSILNGHGSFTVFVPSNHAVDLLRDGRLIYLLTQGKHKLLELVKHHIFSAAAVTLDKLITMPQILTSANEIVKISISANGRIYLGESGVGQSDIVASNGVIHVVDGVLIPSSILPILPHRCNETHYEDFKGECSTCDSILPCPDESIDLGTINKGCSLENSSNVILGCARNCRRAITELGCCSGFYGPNCLPCYAGFNNPCYGRGVCADGILGDGKCSCYPPFKGSACHICMNLNKHGENCDEDCKCVHGICDNRPGSGGVCQGHRCKPGYTGKFCDQTSQSCGELHLSQYCHINASCQSTGNITSCVCSDGYEGDGVSCQPADLCKKPENGCSQNAICTNVGPGIVTCQCNPGWNGDGFECSPIDNCVLENRGGCHVNADCIFAQPGENTCTCKKWFAGDGYQCDAVDPCLEDSGGCHDLATCKPLIGGGRSCTCPEGFDGDGLNCYGDIVMEMSRFPHVSMFNQWLKLSHITISKEVNVTALVPTNTATEAFSKEGKKVWLDSYMLPFLIRAHFLSGSFNSDQLMKYIGQELPTLDPRTKWEIANIKGNISIHNSSFITSNIPASNGFIYIIDKVLLPPIGNIPPARPRLLQQLDQIPAFSMFKEVLNGSGIIQEIESSEQKYTIFVPSNSAVLKFYNDSGTNKMTYVHDVPLDNTFYETRNGMLMGIYEVLRILQNRCDTKNMLIKKTSCTNCNRDIQCPEGSTLQEAPEDGRENCTYQRRNKNVSGCKFYCISTTIVLECCSGYFGPQCLMCPGGLNNVCSNNGSCQGGIAGSGECICKEGFHGTACESCEAGRYGNDCKSECDCVHGRCNDGLTGDGKCQCDKGWSGLSCEKDIKNDLCNGTCSNYANCIVEDSNSTASCSCIAGFTGNGTHCTEIDVCATHNGGCSRHANCRRVAAGEASCTCTEDYTGDGVVCIEINACLEHNGGCHSNAECVTTGPNKIACNCLSGYEGDGIKSCDPINLCKENNGGCSPFAICRSTGPAMRRCRCKINFIGDGFTCSGNINEILRYHQEFIFALHLQTQGVRDLGGEGPFTVFVPQDQFILPNSTFAEWKSKSLLNHLLRYHMVGCKMLLNSDLQNETILTPLSGGQMKISSKEDGIYINNVAKITKTDFMAANGVIHFIDRVLDPEIQPRISNITQNVTLDLIQATDLYGYSVFGKLLQDTKLLSLVINNKVHQPFTMLWPTNEAFESLPEEHKKWLYHTDHKDKLEAYLKVHMIRNTKIIATNLPKAKSLRTMHGSTISFTCSQTNIGDILVDENNGRIIQRNIEFENGIAHGINHLLEPPDIGARCDDFRNVNHTDREGGCSVCGYEPACPDGQLDMGETRRCPPPFYSRRVTTHLGRRYSSRYLRPFVRIGYCKRVCYLVYWHPECCKNHYGKDCHVCPGGLESPCSNHGMCNDGMSGTGRCSCSEGFHGTACEICDPQRYGSSCKACNCTENGKCNDGLSGDGSCFCTEGWSGESCEIKLERKPVCSPECHVNATCRDNNVCECDLYYEGDGRTCNVIDQCQDANGGCSAHASCIQIEVSVTCECFTGYEGDGVVCIPIDLCMNGLNGGCSEHATCTYTGPNTRKCECHDGYVGNGVQCLEKATPPVDRCLEKNGDCHSVATCTDLHFQEKTAGVFHFQSPKGKYQLTYPEAEKSCESEGAFIATFSQLSAAQQLGFHLCIVGWLQNWSAGYPTSYPSPACASNHVGIVDYKQRTNKSEMWDVFCYREQDVRCSCDYGYVGDGVFCNGNLLEVLEGTPNLSTFYSLLLNYANATEDGMEFLRFLSNETSWKTLFVPEDGSFDKNLTLTWRDLEHHVYDVDILPYSNLTSGFVLPSKIGFNLSISIPLSGNCTETTCVKAINDKVITQWDIPAFNGIIHIIKGPLKAPLVQEQSDSPVTYPVTVGLTAALLALLLGTLTMVGFFYYRQQNKGFRFRQFKSEDDDEDDDDDGSTGTAGRVNPPLVSIPNPMYGDGNFFYEPFEDCEEGL
uniref:Stabilin-1 n=1 Tax=Leptobrachium leishanense TaxID=445787 RepID=A0A8C5QWV6_9ANUR